VQDMKSAERPHVSVRDRRPASEEPCGRRWPRRFERLCLASLILVSVLLHAHSLWLGFWFDDHYHLELCRQDGIRVLTNGNRFEWAGRIMHVWWAQREMSYAYFRPLAILLRATELCLFRLHAWCFHVVQLTFHVLTVVLLYALVRRCCGGRGMAWMASLFFTLHPVQANTVAWLANDAPVLVGFWTMAGLCLAHSSARLGHRRTAPLAGIFLCYLCAMLSRENGIMFGPLVVLFDLLWARCAPGRLGLPTPSAGKLRWLFYAALAIEGVGFLAVRALCLGAAPLPHSPYVHWPTDPGFLSWLAYKLLHNVLSLPLALPFFPIADVPWLQARPVTVGVLLFLLVVVGLIFLWPLRRSWVMWGLLAGIGLTMLPTLPAFSVPHNLYLPSAAWAVLLALWTQRLWLRRRALVVGTLTVLLGLYGCGQGTGASMLHDSQAAEQCVLAEVAATDPASYLPGTSLFFVNLPMAAGQIGSALHLMTGRPDLQVYPLTLIPGLAPAEGQVHVVQEDEHSLLVATEGVSWFAGQAGELVVLGWFGSSRADLRPGPFPTPAVAGSLPFRVEIVKANREGVQALRFVFDRPLDDPHYRFFVGSIANAAQCQSFPDRQTRGDKQPASERFYRLQSRQRSLDRAIELLDRCP
jgi:hypothetical protein